MKKKKYGPTVGLVNEETLDLIITTSRKQGEILGCFTGVIKCLRFQENVSPQVVFKVAQETISYLGAENVQKGLKSLLAQDYISEIFISSLPEDLKF